MFDYKIVAHEENGHYWSSCPDIPEAHSVGDTLEELVANAEEGIALAMSIYVERRKPIPESSDRGDLHVRLPGVIVAKALLWNLLVRDGKTRGDLAEMLKISPTAAGRLIDFEHASKLESIENALALFGLRLHITSVDAYAVGTVARPRMGVEV
ncbi:type II toxin-antitoxin system HicB family antitoxin [Pseudomonas sp. ChxA]|uniref:Type II toxin-antitoxin system HicB family antitoxin n=1 Tax=Pseudomonas yamanorum TaxID=515393 RepID=A0AAJ3H6H6_9PSED|nr:MULTISPECIES: type II toxin-antitoxin system HicB family antitoxin [Pseudomonas]MDL2186733.1 type II toxin-antitoxin system HicB family antitoxin [Pseudomonas sp. ChxA]NWB62384.1 type II toxin-antitoxin system HicB family antitoxin [Pseudomonas sp. F1002]NWD44188.1 type II toxin-antitoxin system HicB family antitoxin [Pseudomonas yamanorum]